MILLYILSVYLILGILFSIPFLLRWIEVVDEATHNTHWSFKLTLLPGCVVFWPVLLRKYFQRKD